MPSWLLSALETFPQTARLTKREATEATAGFRPASMRRSSSVTLTGTSAKSLPMAGSPSAVPGILMNRYARTLVEIARCCQRPLRVMGQKWRDLEAHPAVHVVGPREDGPDKLRGPGQFRRASSRNRSSDDLADIAFRAVSTS